MNKKKIIVAGCGGMSNAWIDYAMQREDCEIVGLVDLYPEVAQNMADKKGLNSPIYSDLEKAITESNANLVFDVTIPASHRDVVTTALKAGCDVMGEKPLAESMEDANAIVEVVKSTGKRHAVMQNRRFTQQVKAYRDFVQSGTIGKLGGLHADFFLAPHFGGFRDAMDHPLLLDMAIHTFDQARFISGADAVSVYCHEYNPVGSWYKGNAAANCIFEMSDGSVFTYRGSWCAEGLNTSWEADWRANGSLGTAVWDGSKLGTYQIIDVNSATKGELLPVREIEVSTPYTGHEGHWGCLEEMFNALDENRPAETDSLDNVKSVAMVFGAVESAKNGQKVSLAYNG